MPQRLFHFPSLPGGQARVWEVCLPASSSSSSSPNSRKELGRLQLRRERESRQAVPAGEGGGGRGLEREARSRRSKRHPHPSQTGTDAPTLTHSHPLGPVPRTPPALRGHPDTLSQFCQSPGHSLDTHGAPGPHLPQTNRVGSRQQPEGGEGDGGRKDSRRRGLRSQSPGSWSRVATRLSQNPVRPDNPGHLARGPASFPHPPHHHHPKGGWGAGQVEITLFVHHGDRVTFPTWPSPRPQCSPTDPTDTRPRSCPAHAAQRTGNWALRLVFGGRPRPHVTQF